jgi:hypothetical protein
MILMDIKDEGKASGVITAKLLNGPAVATHDQSDASHLSHRHQGYIQVFTGPGDYADPKALKTKDIGVAVLGDEFVMRDQSYHDHCPNISAIAKAANLGESSGPNERFVSHTITINRGRIRARDLVFWDGGAAQPVETDACTAYRPAEVKFMGADVKGFVATECVVEVEEANSVQLSGSGYADLDRRHTGSAIASRGVPEGTVEILITNYAPRRKRALPWAMHYRWMFEAAGYRLPMELPRHEIETLMKIGERYDADALANDLSTFAHDGMGYPFPYIDPATALVELPKLRYPAGALTPADPWDPVRCPMGTCPTGC